MIASVSFLLCSCSNQSQPKRVKAETESEQSEAEPDKSQAEAAKSGYFLEPSPSKPGKVVDDVTLELPDVTVTPPKTTKTDLDRGIAAFEQKDYDLAIAH